MMFRNGAARMAGWLAPALVLVVGLFTPVRAQRYDERIKLEWVVKDTSVSKSFLRNYIETRDQRIRAAKSDEEPERVQIDDFLIVEFSVPMRRISAVKALAPDGVLTTLDMSVVSGMDPGIVERLRKRQYRWEELSESGFDEYVSETVALFAQRNNRACQDAFWWPPFVTSASLPSFWLSRLNNDLGLEVLVGNDEYCYVWGSAGIARVGLANRFAKLYLTVPIDGITEKNLTGGMGGGLSIDMDKYGGGLMYQRVDPDSGRLSLEYAGYAYYSNTIELSRTSANSALRWKLGPSVLVYKKALDTSPSILPDEQKRSEAVPALFARVELISGMFEGLRLSRFEFAAQAYVGTKKHFFASVAWNIADWFGIEFKASSIIPEDSWRSKFVFLIQPKIRL